MDNIEKPSQPEPPTATDAEVESAAKQLGLSVGTSATSTPRSRSGQIVQTLAHGRSHAVAVEIKHSRRQST